MDKVSQIMKIICVTGIKSEYDILYPVLIELQEKNHDLSIVASGAHLSEYHNNTFARIIEDGFTIVDNIDTLLSTDRSVQRSKGTGLLIQGLTQTVERINPEFLLVVVDLVKDPEKQLSTTSKICFASANLTSSTIL